MLGGGGKRQQITAPLAILNEPLRENDFDPFEAHKRPKIVDRENEYKEYVRAKISCLM